MQFILTGRKTSILCLQKGAGRKVRIEKQQFVFLQAPWSHLGVDTDKQHAAWGQLRQSCFLALDGAEQARGQGALRQDVELHCLLRDHSAALAGAVRLCQLGQLALLFVRGLLCKPATSKSGQHAPRGKQADSLA